MKNVNTVELKPPEWIIKLCQHSLLSEVECFGPVWWVSATLGGDVVTMSWNSSQSFTKNLLWLTISIEWWSVEEVDASSDACLHTLREICFQFYQKYDFTPQIFLQDLPCQDRLHQPHILQTLLETPLDQFYPDDCTSSSSHPPPGASLANMLGAEIRSLWMYFMTKTWLTIIFNINTNPTS